MLYENDYFCTMEEKVVLVDEKDRVIGLMGKTQAHQEGLLHRAISIDMNQRARLVEVGQRE